MVLRSSLVALLWFSIQCWILQAHSSNRSLSAFREWNNFKVKHSKVYDSPVEEHFRRLVWRQNLNKITQHNRHNLSFKLAMNAYGDLLHREFSVTHFGTRRRKTNFITAKISSTRSNSRNNRSKPVVGESPGIHRSAPLPASVDWRARGAVTPVKEQGDCGSCWAFATTGSLEAQHFLKTGQLVSLSEQNLVDCVNSDDVHGCHAGVMDDAFIYVRNNGGIDSEESYPYEAKKGLCRYDPANKAATDVGYIDLPEGDELALKAAVALVGPVAAGMDASHPNFQFYSNGIYKDANCTEENINHGVLIVGYGTSQEGIDYWLLKNSWGKYWGDGGFFQIARNAKDMCGVAAQTSYPVV